MKRVININFQGRVIPIEESAYDVLKQYVESLRKYFANEEGRDEIINDIEGRVAELFGETLKKGATCITDDDVNKIIDSMGRPEDFDGEEANMQQQLGSEQKQSNNASAGNNYQQQQQQQTTTSTRMYRDENNKVLGGVCAGIANYFGIDTTVVRIIFVVLFGVVFIPYLILWVAVPSSSTTAIGSQRKRLFRDAEDKIIAGVCSGLANYFGVSVWIPRLLFLLPFISFAFRWGRHWGFWDFPHFLSISISPGSAIVYIILWLVLPEAKTTAEKLEMKGEKVDLNSIKNTIQNDMEGFGQRAKKWGEEVGQQASELGANLGNRSKAMAAETATVARRSRRTLGDVIVFVFKAFAYFIIGTVLLGVVIALFGAGVALTGLMPVFGFVVAEGWQTVFLWGTIILFIWVPVIGIITFIIRRIARMRGNSNAIRYSFLALWLIGLFCFIGLISSSWDAFRYRNNANEEIVRLKTPASSKLELKIEPYAKYYDNDWFKIEPFASLDEDTVFVRNIRIRIVKSNSDSFQVKMVKLANGRSRQQADELVAKMDFPITQVDTVLTLAKGIAINRKDKFRNQHIVLTVAVPVGKRILIHKDAGWNDDVRFWNERNDWNWENDEKTFDWRHDVEYVMTQKGLRRVNLNKDYFDNGDQNDELENRQYRDIKTGKIKTYRELRDNGASDADIDALIGSGKIEEVKQEKKPLKEEKVNTDSGTRYNKYVPEKPKKIATDAQKATSQVETSLGTSSLLMMRFCL
jgi:phage shock protein PspC (stress-responsive transcriptional regulator)